MGAVIVTYFPDPAALSTLLKATSPQVWKVILIDNTPAPEMQSTLESLAPEADRIINGTNRGLAAAQNQGIQRAAALGCSHVLLLDQDSVPTQGMTEALVRASAGLQAEGVPLAAVGPRWYDRNRGRNAPFTRLGWARMHKLQCQASDEVIECDTLVASGCLIPLSVLDEVGLMDESLFIDQVDVEWGLRAQSCGRRLFGVCAAELLHAIGERNVRVWFSPGRQIPVHSPVRDYYLVRNTIEVFFRRPAPWRWRLLQAVQLPGLMLVMITQMAPRLQRARRIGRGLLDGLRGRLGSAPFG